MLKARADVVRRFMKAYLEGVRYYKSQKEVAIRTTMARLLTNDRSIGVVSPNHPMSVALQNRYESDRRLRLGQPTVLTTTKLLTISQNVNR